MGTLTIQIDDDDMAWLANAARALNIEPEKMTGEDLQKLLANRSAAMQTAMPEESDPPDRATRRAALMQLQALWKPDPSLPVDGVEYQKAMRAE